MEMIEKPMRTYLVSYNFPLRYRGSYITTATDGIQAGRKVRDYLHNKYGYAGDEVSTVTELYDNGVQFIA